MRHLSDRVKWVPPRSIQIWNAVVWLFLMSGFAVLNVLGAIYLTASASRWVCWLLGVPGGLISVVYAAQRLVRVLK